MKSVAGGVKVYRVMSQSMSGGEEGRVNMTAGESGIYIGIKNGMKRHFHFFGGMIPLIRRHFQVL